MPEGQAASGWGFNRTFWIANGSELLERAAWYGLFISLSLYLTQVVGFTDVKAGWIAGLFSGFMYFAPTFAGAIADSIGFRRALLVAFASLAAGYGVLGFLPTEAGVYMALTLIMVGGAFVKVSITGTVAQSSQEANRARAYSIFYQIVNIGAFTGKTIAKPLRTGIGLESIPIASALFALTALLLVFFLYKNLDVQGTKRSFKTAMAGLVKVLLNLRFISLVIIVGGFWAIQGQLYATMPKYVIRMVGEQAAPEWYANVNPLVVVLLVIPITALVKNLRPVASIGIALAIIPCAALLMSLSPVLSEWTGGALNLGSLAVHPITVMMILGIATMGVAECFLSPRFLEYASKQAPPGETATYLGYSYLTSFFGNILGFGISGYMLEAWCPDPSKMDPEIGQAHSSAVLGQGPMPAEWAHSHYIWYVFAGIGLAAFVALLIYRWITDYWDSRRGGEATR